MPDKHSIKPRNRSLAESPRDPAGLDGGYSDGVHIAPPQSMEMDRPLADGIATASRRSASFPVRAMEMAPNRRFKVGDRVVTYEAGIHNEPAIVFRVAALVADEEVVVEHPSGDLVQYGFDEILPAPGEKPSGKRRASASFERKTRGQIRRRMAGLALEALCGRLDRLRLSASASLLRKAASESRRVVEDYAARPRAIARSRVASASLLEAKRGVGIVCENLRRLGRGSLAEDVSSVWAESIAFRRKG
jgi:hypothetical protein